MKFAFFRPNLMAICRNFAKNIRTLQDVEMYIILHTSGNFEFSVFFFLKKQEPLVVHLLFLLRFVGINRLCIAFFVAAGNNEKKLKNRYGTYHLHL